MPLRAATIGRPATSALVGVTVTNRAQTARECEHGASSRTKSYAASLQDGFTWPPSRFGKVSKHCRASCPSRRGPVAGDGIVRSGEGTRMDRGSAAGRPAVPNGTCSVERSPRASRSNVGKPEPAVSRLVSGRTANRAFAGTLPAGRREKSAGKRSMPPGSPTTSTASGSSPRACRRRTADSLRVARRAAKSRRPRYRARGPHVCGFKTPPKSRPAAWAPPIRRVTTNPALRRGREAAGSAPADTTLTLVTAAYTWVVRVVARR